MFEHIKSNKKIAIIDANNFYCSCERLFDPQFENKPTVVLSNNDGCIIARSQEVKDMGIKMGQPLFKLDKPIKEKIKKFSSNYTLYGDISDRIVTILKRLISKVEVYSIDESFLDLSHISDDKILEECHKIKDIIQKQTGIPVSIGVAPNKTLAKLCNFISKKKKDEYNGVCSYYDIDIQLLKQIDIDEVWGIGRNYKKRLQKLDVVTVEDFISVDPSIVRKFLHVTGLRTWLELNGGLCYEVETNFKKPKMITSSRTFGSTVWEHSQVKNAFWTFLENCHLKLVRENLTAYKVTLFATTNRFDENYFVWSVTLRLLEQTSDIKEIWNQISYYLDSMPVRLYYKAGINLHSLTPKEFKQETLVYESFEEATVPEVEVQKWMTRRDFLSKNYTTSWEELPLVF
jgi:DNA polymerase V